MKRFFKTSIFVIVMATIVISSKSIRHEIDEDYDQYIGFMASNVQIPYSF